LPLAVGRNVMLNLSTIIIIMGRESIFLEKRDRFSGRTFTVYYGIRTSLCIAIPYFRLSIFSKLFSNDISVSKQGISYETRNT